MRYLLLLICLIIPASVSAAQIEVSAPRTIGVGETVQAEVSLYTEGAMVNAVEGMVYIPEGFKVTELRFNRSIVPYWVETPNESEPGTVTFAGMLPGGYQNGEKTEDSEGNLFTLVLTAQETGSVVLRISPDTSAYLNDGEGTAVSLRKEGASIAVTETASGGSYAVDIDTVAPETPEVEIVEGSFFGQEGRVFVFSALDKDSGVKGYEIARSYVWLPDFMRSYVTAESPSPLYNTDQYGLVWVRAMDAYNNHSSAQISPSGFLGYVPTLILVILMCALFYRLIIHKKVIITS